MCCRLSCQNRVETCAGTQHRVNLLNPHFVKLVVCHAVQTHQCFAFAQLSRDRCLLAGIPERGGKVLFLGVKLHPKFMTETKTEINKSILC